jgi:sugar lactone lactonase YvrE
MVLIHIDAERQLLSAEDGLYIRTIRDGQLSLFCPLEAEDAGTRSNDGFEQAVL